MRMMMIWTDNSICSDAAGHTSHGKKSWVVGHIGAGGKGAAQRGRESEKGGKVGEKKSRRNNQSVRRRGRGGGGEKRRKRGRKGSLRMMGDEPPGLVRRPYGNDVVGHDDQVNSSSKYSLPLFFSLRRFDLSTHIVGNCDLFHQHQHLAFSLYPTFKILPLSPHGNDIVCVGRPAITAPLASLCKQSIIQHNPSLQLLYSLCSCTF